MSKVDLITGGGEVGRAMVRALSDCLAVHVITCDPYDDYDPGQDLCITDEEYYGKRNKKGKLKKDWHR